MRKFTFLLAGAAAVLAACSTTETVDQPSGPAIGFTGAYIGNAVETKAVNELTTEGITEFYVYGGYNDFTHVFNNVKVYKSGTDWKYDGNLRYWVANKTYKFAAYAPAAVGSYVQTDFTDGTLAFADVVSDPANQNDLIYAKANPITPQGEISGSNPGKVQFTFNHLLSMIRFTFASGFGNDITVTVSNLKVYGMVSKGTYDADVWEMGADKVVEGTPFSEMKSTVAENTTSGNTTAVSADFAVIPQEINAADKVVNVSFDVKVQDASGQYIIGSADAAQTLTTTLPAIEWEKGNRYNYNVTIKGSSVGLFPIEFGDPTVTPITDNEQPEIAI